MSEKKKREREPAHYNKRSKSTDAILVGKPNNHISITEKDRLVAAFKALRDKDYSAWSLLEKVIKQRDDFDSVKISDAEMEQIIQILQILSEVDNVNNDVQNIGNSYGVQRYFVESKKFYEILNELPNDVLMGLSRLEMITHPKAKELFAILFKEVIDESIKNVTSVVNYVINAEREYLLGQNTKEKIITDYLCNYELFSSDESLTMETLTKLLEFLTGDNLETQNADEKTQNPISVDELIKDLPDSFYEGMQKFLDPD